MFILTLLILGAGGGEPQNIVYCDTIEISYLYDYNGRQYFKQYIYWEWNKRKTKSVMHWLQEANNIGPPIRNHITGEIKQRMISRSKAKELEIRAKAFTVSHNYKDDDPERNAREFEKYDDRKRHLFLD